MAAPSNLSFETPGAPAGTGFAALAWTMTPTAELEEYGDFIANFGDAVTKLPYEWFEGWYVNKFAFVGVSPTSGFDLAQPNLTTLSVNPKHVEDFEELWSSNQTSLFELDSPTFGITDDIESGWNNAVLLLEYDDPPTQLTGPFATNTPEFFDWPSPFYDEWADLTSPALGPFRRDGLLDGWESFEDVRPPVPFTVDPASDIFTSIAHGLIPGDLLTVDGAGVPPEPLMRDVPYFVATTTTDEFQISDTPAGAPLNIISTGSSFIVFVRDSAKYWTDPPLVL